MGLIDGLQLSTAQRIMGQTQNQLTGVTHLDADHVQYTVPLAPELLRRSLSASTSTGLFLGIMENVHSGADDEACTFDPYIPDVFGAGVAQNGYPSPVPAGFDFWVINATLLRTSGAGSVTAVLRQRSDLGFAVGWGIDDVQAPVVGSTSAPVMCHWTGFDAVAAGTEPVGLETGTGKAYAIPLMTRIRRGMLLVLSTTSSAAVEVQAIITCGLFPEGLGQDVIG